MDPTNIVVKFLCKCGKNLCIAAYKRKKCCVCVELDIGSLIMGYLNLIGSIGSVILYLFLVLNKFPDDETISPEGYENFLILSIFTLDIIFATILLVGLRKVETSRIKIWLIFIVCYIVINILLAFCLKGLSDEVIVFCAALSKIHCALVIKTYLSVLTDDDDSSSISSNDSSE